MIVITVLWHVLIDFHCHKIRAVTFLIQCNINFLTHFPLQVKPCGIGLRESGVVQHAEAMVYAINNINANPRLLQGVTLGFVILDDCLKPTTALAQVRSLAIPVFNACLEFDSGSCA